MAFRGVPKNYFTFHFCVLRDQIRKSIGGGPFLLMPQSMVRQHRGRLRVTNRVAKYNVNVMYKEFHDHELTWVSFARQITEIYHNVFLYKINDLCIVSVWQIDKSRSEFENYDGQLTTN